jgi:hypothetical protein
MTTTVKPSTPRTYTDFEIKTVLRIVEKKLCKRKALVSGGSFDYEDIANEAVAAVIEKNLPLSCAYQKACWIRIDKIRQLTSSRKKGTDGLVICRKPIPVSMHSAKDDQNNSLISMIEDKSGKADFDRTFNYTDFKQLLGCIPAPDVIKLILEDVCVNGLNFKEAGAKQGLSSSNTIQKFTKCKSTIADYLERTGRHTQVLIPK